MKVGLFVTNQHPLRTDMVSALAEQYVMVRHARDRGWDSVFTGQHYLNEGDNQQLQGVPFLARLQAEAGEMTLGLGILLLPLHNPVYVAETVASLDVLCRGNFVFGVGLGYRETEFDAFRVPRGARVRRFEECLALARRLWRGEEVTHESEVCRLERVRMTIRPVQTPHPPIWIAANADRAVRRAARLGDTWLMNPQSDFDTLRRQVGLFRAERKACGKPFPEELPCIRELFCAKDRKTAREVAGPFIAEKFQNYAAWGQEKAMPGGEKLAQPIEEMLRERIILGPPGECFEQIRTLREKTGVNHLLIRTHWTGMPLSAALSSMQLISRELLPELRRL